MATFTWIPSKGFASDYKPRTLEAKFGDGYSQRVPDGINTNLAKWSLQFRNISLTTSDEIIAFLDARKGTEAFTWTPPGKSQSVSVICKEYTESYIAPVARTIQAKFEQVPEVVV